MNKHDAGKLLREARFEDEPMEGGGTRIRVQIDEFCLVRMRETAMRSFGSEMGVASEVMVLLIDVYRDLRPRLANALEQAIAEGELFERLADIERRMARLETPAVVVTGSMPIDLAIETLRAGDIKFIRTGDEVQS